MIGDIYEDASVSAYTPPKDVADFTAIVKKDYAFGQQILDRSWVELNNMSVIDRDNRDRRTFNAFVDESIEDPATAWQWRGTRSKARNKAIAMHAQLTAGYIIPMFMAQNEDDEEDRGFSDIMRDIVEWMAESSNYRSSFLMASMGMLVNSVTYMGAEWAEVYQTIKEKTDKGYTTKEILDEVLSGFQAPIYSSDQILISNAYDQNIQRHRCNISRKYIEYGEAQAKYGEHEYWDYIKPGIKTLYSDTDGRFYDVKDDDHPFLVEEVTYKNRREDTEVCFLNGIYTGDVEDTEANPMRHRDNRGAPKYNIVPFGYQRINEHFFFYKSLMNAHYWDNALLDAQYELGMNRAFLDTNMPVAVSGQDEVDSDIIFPNAVVAFKDSNTKVTPLLPAANLGQMFEAMHEVERSMDEGSVSDQSAGQVGDPNQKATAIAIAAQNARTMLAGVGKTLAESMVQYGSLMADIAVTHLSVADVQELGGGTTKLKYRNFILNNKSIGGRNVSKAIKFDGSLVDTSMSETERRDRNLALLQESGYPNNKSHLYLVNPELFARMKYLTRVEPERMFPRNEEFMQALMTQILPQFENNPYIDLEALTRKAVYAFFRGEGDDLIKKQPAVPSALLASATPAAGAAKGSQMGAQATSRALSTALPTPGVGA